MNSINHQTLIARCLKKDAQSWAQFVEHFARLISWAIKTSLKRANYRYNQHDVEDIFQNVFALLWEKDKLQQIRYRENISSWLVMVAGNCALNYFRNQRKEVIAQKVITEKTTSSNISLTEVFDQEKITEIFEEVFCCLPARERIIFKLSYLHHKTHREIGEIIKMPANTVSSTIKRSKEKLKQELKRQGWENF